MYPSGFIYKTFNVICVFEEQCIQLEQKWVPAQNLGQFIIGKLLTWLGLWTNKEQETFGWLQFSFYSLMYSFDECLQKHPLCQAAG